MESILIALVGSLLTLTCAACDPCSNKCTAPIKPITCFIPRSQSFHNELKNAVMDPFNQFIYIDNFNCSLNAMVEYNDSFNSNKLGQWLFGQAAACISADGDNAAVLKIVGTQASVPPNGITDLVADNFFLPKDFSSTLILKPSISNVNLHLQAYWGFDEWLPGLYLRIYAPVAFTKWELEANEYISNAGTVGYAEGEISPAAAAVPTTALFDKFLTYAQGKLIPNNGQLPGSTDPVVAGPTVQGLRYTRFGGCDTDTTAQLADLRAEAGWNFCLDADYHLGLYLAMAAPTSNDCSDDCDGLLWGAKAGNGKHWELGGGLTGHYTFWRSEDRMQRFDLFVDVTVNHVFAHNERRTFDLKNKPLSRYLFAQQLTTAADGLAVGGVAAQYQFDGAFAPVANLTTRVVNISFPVQADAMAKFIYTYGSFSWALGYDFWAQACPHVEVDANNPCNTFTENSWALRGDAHLYGFDAISGNPIALPATYNATTPFAIGTAFEGPNSTLNNAGVDNPGLVTNGADEVVTIQGGGTQINGSNPPIFIKATDIDINNVTRGMSNEIFTELNYSWLEHPCWIPYVGIGARIELGKNDENGANLAPNAPGTCNSCGSCTASVWGVWLRAGITFQ